MESLVFVSLIPIRQKKKKMYYWFLNLHGINCSERLMFFNGSPRNNRLVSTRRSATEINLILNRNCEYSSPLYRRNSDFRCFLHVAHPFISSVTFRGSSLVQRKTMVDTETRGPSGSRSKWSISVPCYLSCYFVCIRTSLSWCNFFFYPSQSTFS